MRKTLIYFLIIFTFLVSPLTTFAASFNPNYILSDHDLTDYSSMNSQEIKNFLINKGGTLGKAADMNIKMYIYQIIYNVSRLYEINPKYILALLQKEQSLVTDTNPSQGQLDWATGYGCPDSGGCNPKYKGIANQIDWGAGGIRYYLDNPNEFKYQTGQTYTIDNQQITIANDATRALYTYTPHLHGNQNLQTLWNNWFSLNYPDGTLLQNATDGGIWLIQNNERRGFTSKSVFASRYSFDKVISVKESDLENYSIGQPIKYANYSLLQIPNGGIYLLQDDELRPINSQETFKFLGFNPEEIVKVEEPEIKGYILGDSITIKSAYPTGALLQDNKTGGVYFVQNGIKHPILAREVLKNYYTNKKLTAVSPEELEQYSTGQAIQIPNGELVKAPDNPNVYFISNNLKRLISSGEVFESLGYKWKNIIIVPQKVLDLHKLGEEINRLPSFAL